MYTVDMSDFPTLFLDAYRAGEVRAVTLPATAELHAPVEYLIDVVMRGLIGEEELRANIDNPDWLVQKTCQLLDEHFTDEVESAASSAVMVRLANQIYTSIAENFNKVRNNVTPLVDELAAKVETETTQHMVSRGAEALIEGYTTPKDMVMVNFAPFATERDDAILYQAASDMVHFPVSGALATVMPYVTNGVKLPEHTLILDDADTEMLISNIKKKLQIQMTDAQINECLAIINDPKAAGKLMVDTIVPFTKTIAPPITKTLQMCELSSELLHVVGVMRALDLPYSNERLTFFHENVACVSSMVNAIGYKVVLLKNMCYNKSILLGDKYVNEHVMEEFTEAGGSVDDLVAHYKMIYRVPGMSFPNTGVHAKDILDRKTTVAADEMNHDNRLRNQINVVRLESTVNAFTYVLDSHFKENAASGKIADFNNPKDYCIARHNHTAALASAVTLPNTSVEDCLYRAIMADLGYSEGTVSDTMRLYMEELGQTLSHTSELTPARAVQAKRAATLTQAAQVLCTIETM